MFQVVKITLPTNIPSKSVTLLLLFLCISYNTYFVIIALNSIVYASSHLENSECHKSITSQKVTYFYYVQLVFVKDYGSFAVC